MKVAAILVAMILLALPNRVMAQAIVDVSPTTASFSTLDLQHSVSGRILSLAVSADPTARLYAGTYAGVWRSDDAGFTWRQLTRPQPPQGVNTVPGALMVPNVYDLVVSPINRDLVFAATIGDTRVQPKDGIYRSADGGNTWSLVHQFGCSGGGPVGQVVFAPDNPNLLFAAGGCAIGISTDSGLTWVDQEITGTVWHVAVAPQEDFIRRVYAAGDGQIWYSQDGGQTWFRDNAPLPNTAGGRAGDCCGNSAHVLTVEPGHPDHVYLAVPGLANGRSYYHPTSLGPDGQPANTPPDNPLRPAGEGSVWLGDYSGFVVGDPNRQVATWMQLPGPPLYYWGSTDSGNVYLEAEVTSSGYLLFFSDRAHVHVSLGRPTPTSWHRLDGRDVSQGRLDGCFGNDNNGNQGCNQLFVHVDPHALAVSSDFNITLQPPTGVSFPYDQNSVLDQYLSGTLWTANDGGVYRSTDAGQLWELGSGLATLTPVNVAGLATPGRRPALYMGTADNDDFYSLDGGATWGNPVSDCGDCDSWFADPAQPFRVLSFAPRDNPPGFGLYISSTDNYPNAGDASQRRAIPVPSKCSGGGAPPCPAGQGLINESNVVSFYALKGYRPIVLTLAGESPRGDGDYVLIQTKQDGTRVLLRTTTLSTISSPVDWANPAKAVQQGPNLPPNVDVVQASGGHASPVFYVGDPSSSMGLWKWTGGMSVWQQVVPGGPPNHRAMIARRFFVDPYNPNVIYIVDQDAIKRSDDGGVTWNTDTGLDVAATENGTFTYDGDGAVIKDMVFDRQEAGTRFALGNAGVFSTLDEQNWSRLLSTTALPGHPIAGYFDSVSDPAGRALYVALPGRGILMLSLESLTNAPPTCSKAVASPSLLWPLNHNFVNVSVQGVTDPDGDPVTIQITGIIQDEPMTGDGTGNTCPDGMGVGTSTAQLRAERSGEGDGRVYHVSFSADDGRGRQCTGMVTVCVPHDQAPSGRCVDEGPLFDSTTCP